jgi:hypothetical protein
MLALDIQSILNSIPHEIRWQDIVQFEKIDDRVTIADDLCANIIGVNEGTIECGSQRKPTQSIRNARLVVGCASRFRSGDRH